MGDILKKITFEREVFEFRLTEVETDEYDNEKR